MESQKLINLKNHMDRSPLIKYIKEHEITIFEEEKKPLEEIREIMGRNLSALERPINVVVMGEVKSGKSTFVNAFSGKLVSTMDVLEATATVHEIKYGSKECVKIKMHNERDVTLNSLSEYHSYLQNTIEDSSLSGRIDKVSLYLENERFKKINLVDTPGLNTVTTENILKTDNYIVNADAIIWILNAHHLGQSDIQNKIFKMRDFGKPIIGIINRCDEVNGDPQELLEYVEEEMGFLFTKVFITSAKLAWEGTIEGDYKKVSGSKINTIFDYIVNNIEKDSDEFQKSAQVESSTVQHQRDIDLHRRAKIKLDKVLHGAEEKIVELDLFHATLDETIKHKIEAWANNGFMTKEYKEMRETRNNRDFSTVAAKYLNEAYVETVIQEKYQEVSNDIFNEWLSYKSVFIEREKNSILVIDDFNDVTIKQIHLNNSLTSDMKTGGLTLGTFGLGIAAYDALLAPWAAYYTIGLTTSALVPPLLIAGVLAGGAYHFVNKDKKMDERNRSLEDNISNIKSIFKSQLMHSMIDTIKKTNASYFEEAKAMVIALLEQGDTKIETLENLSKDMNSYINLTNVM